MPGAEHISDHIKLHSVLQKHFSAGRPLGGICAAPAIVFEQKVWCARIPSDVRGAPSGIDSSPTDPPSPTPSGAPLLSSHGLVQGVPDGDRGRIN
eukprot:183975-Prorocentrum_minimum.AAC.5